jgi:NAD(P)-dependent dehydrogenase (short-subunit alcohol dehydrogenase family)
MAVHDWLRLDGRSALVAGAGGLGGASALALAAQGVHVLLADVDAENLDAVQSRGRDQRLDVEVLQADLLGPDRCREVAAEAVRRLGRMEIFVHAVGRNIRRPVLEIGDEDWEQILTLNLSSAHWLGQAVGRLMCANGYGRMVFLSSVSGMLAHADHAPYAASKGGLNQLLRVMAREWAPHNVTVNGVAPGYVQTELTSGYLAKDGVRTALTSLVPAQRLGRPEEVADAVTFLASDRAAFVTGHILYVDGGRVLV